MSPNGFMRKGFYGFSCRRELHSEEETPCDSGFEILPLSSEEPEKSITDCSTQTEKSYASSCPDTSARALGTHHAEAERTNFSRGPATPATPPSKRRDQGLASADPSTWNIEEHLKSFMDIQEGLRKGIMQRMNTLHLDLCQLTMGIQQNNSVFGKMLKVETDRNQLLNQMNVNIAKLATSLQYLAIQQNAGQRELQDMLDMHKGVPPSPLGSPSLASSPALSPPPPTQCRYSTRARKAHVPAVNYTPDAKPRPAKRGRK